MNLLTVSGTILNETFGEFWLHLLVSFKFSLLSNDQNVRKVFFLKGLCPFEELDERLLMIFLRIVMFAIPLVQSRLHRARRSGSLLQTAA